MKKIISLLLVALMLCGVCGVQAFADGEEPIWGVYTMVDMDDGETENAAELLAMLASMGMASTLTINEDGSAVIDFMGETINLNFDFNAQTAVSEGEAIPYTLEGDTITFSKDGLFMVFSKTGFPEKTGVGVFSCYELTELTDADGNPDASVTALRESGEIITLMLFEAGDAVMDVLGETDEYRFDLENMTATDLATGEVLPVTMKDEVLVMGDVGGAHMLFEICDPGWAGDYQVIALASESEGDLTEQLAMLSAIGMAPTLSIDENGDGVLNLFGVEVALHFDFDTLLVSSEEDGSELPFSYKFGKLSMENDGAYMTFARAVLDESALNLAEMIGAVG